MCIVCHLHTPQSLPFPHPRACVCVPEVSAFTVRGDTHARFVLASDGLWDIVGLEEVRCVGMSDKFRDPRALAQHLALKVRFFCVQCVL